MNEMDGYLTLKQAAEILKLTAQRTGQLVAERGVAVRHVGAARLIAVSAVDGLRVRNKVGRPTKEIEKDPVRVEAVGADATPETPETERHATEVPEVKPTVVLGAPHKEHDHYCGTCGRTIDVYNDARLKNPCGMRGCKGDVLCRERG